MTSRFTPFVATLLMGLFAASSVALASPWIHTIASECDDNFALGDAETCGDMAVELGVEPDFNDAGQIAFSDATGIYRYDLMGGGLITLATYGQQDTTCGKANAGQMDAFGPAVRINDAGDVAWTAGLCYSDQPLVQPRCPDCPVDDDSVPNLCGQTLQRGLFAGNAYGFERMVHPGASLWEADFEMLEDGGVVAASFSADACDASGSTFALRRVDSGATLLAFGQAAPDGLGTFGHRHGPWSVTLNDTFVSFSGGKSAPELVHAFSQDGSPAGWSHLLDHTADKKAGFQTMLSCGGSMDIGPSSFSGGKGSKVKLGTVPTAAKPTKSRAGKSRAARCAMYTPIADAYNKPDLGCVACATEAPAVVWATRTVGHWGMDVPCGEGDKVLIEVDTATGGMVTELINLSTTPITTHPTWRIAPHTVTGATAADGIAVFSARFGPPGQEHTPALFAVDGQGMLRALTVAGDPLPDQYDRAFTDFGRPVVNADRMIGFHAEHQGSEGDRVGAIMIMVYIFPPAPPVCVGDLNFDGVVGSGDLMEVLASWGKCTGCDADLNDDGQVDQGDLTEILAGWGECNPS